jgi:hypothetical protein
MRVARMATGTGIAGFADVPYCQRRDGPPWLVIRGEHHMVAMPVPPRRRDEIRQTIEELKRREFDDASGSRSRGLPPATPPDPVGRLVSGQHVTDASDPAVGAANHGESFKREWQPGTGAQQVFETLKIAGHVAVY